ncbi:MAG: hypothetical protein M3O32_06040 [Actinomycetota bacterium]|nr:hypothetical protein [Actinomycetota bacterium]
MFDDPETAQARALLKELHDQVEEISRRIDVVERRHRRTSVRGIADIHRQRSELRRQLYEVHALIDGLHRRYPVTNPVRGSVRRSTSVRQHTTQDLTTTA